MRSLAPAALPVCMLAAACSQVAATSGSDAADANAAADAADAAADVRADADGAPDSTPLDAADAPPSSWSLSSLPLGGVYPDAIGIAPDGSTWVVGTFSVQVGSVHFGLAHVATSGAVATYDLGTLVSGQPLTGPYFKQLVVTGDGAAWFRSAAAVGRVDAGGVVVGVVKTPFSSTAPLTVDAAGRLWWVDQETNRLARLAYDGAGGATAVEVDVSHAAGLPTDLTDAAIANLAADPGGAIWYARARACSLERLEPSGAARFVSTACPDPISPQASAFALMAVGPDGNLWGVLGDRTTVVRASPSGSTKTYAYRTGDGALRMSAGPRALWFVQSRGYAVGDTVEEMDLAGNVTVHDLGGAVGLADLAVAKDGEVRAAGHDATGPKLWLLRAQP